MVVQLLLAVGFCCDGVKRVAAIAEMDYLTDNYLAAQSALRDNYHTARSVSRSIDIHVQFFFIGCITEEHPKRNGFRKGANAPHSQSLRYCGVSIWQAS